MGVFYYCENKKRIALVRDSKGADKKPILNGIDYLEVESSDQKTLEIHFIHNLPGTSDGVPANSEFLSKENVLIKGGVRIKNINIDEDVKCSEKTLTIKVDSPGDFSTYTLSIVKSSNDPTAPEGFDPQLSEIKFSFKVSCPNHFDCKPTKACPEVKLQDPLLDYLAKDYSSFRRLMLDRLSLIMPDWHERNPADLGIVLVELMAYAADYLSYYQDAVATEAYLGTARKRTSVRRHARLFDYDMHEGCNARVWVQIQTDADNVPLDKGTKLLTRVPGFEIKIKTGSPAYNQALSQQPEVFETMNDITLYKAHNCIELYTWGDEKCCLPKGATRATLCNPNKDLKLKPGDFLIFEEITGLKNGFSRDPDPSHRHCVRLIDVIDKDSTGKPKIDPLTDESIVEVKWHDKDALPFPLCLWEVEADDLKCSDRHKEKIACSIARGNVVLADHGRTIEKDSEKLPLPHNYLRFRPTLKCRDITYRVLYDETNSGNSPINLKSATEVLFQDPKEALPADILLQEENDINSQWSPSSTKDLLNSDSFSRNFLVEVEEDRTVALRFGDGVHGRLPPENIPLHLVKSRTGNGQKGNIGADAIYHIITTDQSIEKVSNPLPAAGGIDPEPLERVRLHAPHAFRVQERAVTEADYEEIVQRHPEVQKALAVLQWTGSWYTMFVTVDRRGGLPVDSVFKTILLRFLEHYRLAGHDIEIVAPHFVPLDIAFTVCVAPGYLCSNIELALLEVFSNSELPDGRLGFFHPDNFTFGQSVYLSHILVEAMKVPGVLWIDTTNRPPHRFCRWGESPKDEIEKGMIFLSLFEIARVDNDPNSPENGRIQFYMEGGI